MENIFTIKNEDLERLTDREAVEYFRSLLHAEAHSFGISISSINVSGDIYVADGGVDASVENCPIERDLIKKGNTSYQIKTGTDFNPGTNSKLRKELIEIKKGKPQKLKDGIINCLETDGTYILVCFGKEFNDIQKPQAEAAIKGIFKEFGYENSKVEVWGQNQLRAFFYTFPSLSLQITGRGNLPFQSHRSWSDDKDMQPRFEYGEEQKQFIDNLSKELREKRKSIQLRIKGEPGVGKTKSVLEATKSEDLAPLVIYCNADIFEKSELMYELIREDNSFHAILVLDDCNENRREKIWNKLQSKNDRIQVISITNEFVQTSSDVGDLEIPSLATKQLGLIIESYGVPKHIADSWAIECQGFPRVAHVIGQNLTVNPGDPLKSPEINKIWDKFIAGLQDNESVEVKERITVLRHLALFRKFGSPLSRAGIPIISDESKAIANLIKERTGISETRFKEIIKTLKERKILQGEHTLYITPKLLHIKLWSDYWEIYGEIDDIEKFAQDLPGSLYEWFKEMFEYAQNSPSAVGIVDKLLGPNGIYSNISFLNSKSGADFFLTLSKASPKSALRNLKRIINEKSKEDLFAFTEGRRQIVWALERMAEWKELFPDAARVLLKLGEAENETWANNASGIFIELFSNAYGEVAPSEAGPEAKLPILKEAFESASIEQHQLALKACEKALETEHFTRMYGTFGDPLHSSPNRWMPKTYEEWFYAYRGIWNLLLEVVEKLSGNERKIGLEILLRNAFGIGKYDAMVDMAINSIRNLLNKGLLDTNDVLEKITEFLWRDNARKKENMPFITAEAKQKWEAFNKEIAPKDYSSLLQRYVALDIFVEKYSEETGFTTDLTKPIIEDLARQALTNPELLESEYHWLITEKAKRAYELGYEIGRADEERKYLLKFVQVYIDNNEKTVEKKNLNLSLLGGYLQSIREKNVNDWEEILDTIAKNEHLKGYVPALTQASGLTERAAIRIANQFQNKDFSFLELSRFQFGLQIQNLTENTLKKWIRYLLKQPDAHAVNIALDYLCQYYIKESSFREKTPDFPADLGFKALTHKTLFNPSQIERFNQMGTYYWKLLANKYLELFPEASIKFAEILIKEFGQDSCLNRGLDEAPKSVLNVVAGTFPIELWKLVSRFIKIPMDKRTMRIKLWLDDGCLHFGKDINEQHRAVPLHELWKWIDEDVEKRAWFAAWFVPPIISKIGDESPVAREILIRYGDRNDVRNNLNANFGSTGVITGHLSNYYQNRLQEFINLRENEDNPKVIEWLNNYIEQLKYDVEYHRIREEREF